jgi:hypothetical protein
MPNVSGVKFSGPFFEDAKRRRAIRRAVGREVTLLTRETRDDVRVQLYKPKHGFRTGDLKASVASKKYGALAGKVYIKPRGWKAFIKATWIEGVSRRNQSTRFKGFHVFRQARERVRQRMYSSVTSATERAVRELN